jgi:uncharacterized protein (DUF3084 family)
VIGTLALIPAPFLYEQIENLQQTVIERDEQIENLQQTVIERDEQIETKCHKIYGVD